MTIRKKKVIERKVIGRSTGRKKVDTKSSTVPLPELEMMDDERMRHGTFSI